MTGTKTSIAPILFSQISEAADRGLLPTSLHSAAAPGLYALNAQPVEQVAPGLQRQYLSGTNMTFVKWTAKKGSTVPLQHHVNEQFTWITEGACEVYSQGNKYSMKAGDIMLIPANVPHEFIFLEDTIDIDIFAPGRQDWIDAAVINRSR
jgi:quercetin dioxygenase-like cupin family protein